jgi:uncharacterized spore protein YtfJ
MDVHPFDGQGKLAFAIFKLLDGLASSASSATDSEGVCCGGGGGGTGFSWHVTSCAILVNSSATDLRQYWQKK